MARFSGPVGYGESVEKSPGSGVYVDKITERVLTGEVIRNTRQLQDANQLNKQLTVSNSISVVADEYAYGHIFAIRYVKWAGVNWEVSDVEVQRPRLILRLGGIYNGPTAT